MTFEASGLGACPQHSLQKQGDHSQQIGHFEAITQLLHFNLTRCHLETVFVNYHFFLTTLSLNIKPLQTIMIFKHGDKHQRLARLLTDCHNS